MSVSTEADLVTVGGWTNAPEVRQDLTWTVDYQGSSMPAMNVNTSNTTIAPTEGAFDFNKVCITSVTSGSPRCTFL